ncbi:MAG: hypothetical protein OEZ10_03715 [Gammaproteobacteria bacterium]|nr:hypothetical protein [Gammaproteobacteria bacterium]
MQINHTESIYKKALAFVLISLMTACMPDFGDDDDPAPVAPPPPPPPATSDLIVNNQNSTHYVYQLFVRPSTQTSWGSDQLSTYIAPGGTFTLTNIPCDQEVDLYALNSTGSVWWGPVYNRYVTCGNDFTWNLL